jgi:pyruvate dehydrogenase E1 component
VLEAKNLPVGVVTAIAGQSRIRVEFHGVAGHAGTVPMDLRNDALAVERWNRLHPTAKQRVPYVAEALKGAQGPVVVTSDWVKSVNDMPARWITNRFVALGTDGFGRSDTRESLRRHFETDAEHMVVATLHALMQDGKVKPEVVARAISEYQLDPEITDPRDA